MEQRDLARSTNFIFTVEGNSDLAYNIQSSSIAAIELGMTSFPTREKDLWIPSNKIETDPLQITFLISEDYREWIYLYKWILWCKNVDNPQQICAKSFSLVSLNAQHQKGLTFTYSDGFPMSLDAIDYTTNGESKVLSCQVAFRYNRLTVQLPTGEFIDENWREGV